jgi:L-fuconolactonase
VTRPPVVDAHVHFWDPARLEYPWLAETPALQRAFGPKDFLALEQGAVDAVVFVEANCAHGQSLREVRWVEELIEGEPRLAGIVAFVDLLDESSRDWALAHISGLPHVVGVRHNIQHHRTGFALQPVFVRGVQEVAEHGLPFELCITADQLPEAIALVERCPETRFVLDHCGKPAIRHDAFERWAERLAVLALHDRVVCKISGLLTEARTDQRDADALRPYVEQARSCFGASRLLYGSDWPVARLGGGAERWRTIVDELTAEWPEAERHALFGENAARFYDLEVPVHG